MPVSGIFTFTVPSISFEISHLVLLTWKLKTPVHHTVVCVCACACVFTAFIWKCFNRKIDFRFFIVNSIFFVFFFKLCCSILISQHLTIVLATLHSFQSCLITVLFSPLNFLPCNLDGYSRCVLHFTWLRSDRRSHISRSHGQDMTQEQSEQCRLFVHWFAAKKEERGRRRKKRTCVREWMLMHGQQGLFLHWNF